MKLPGNMQNMMKQAQQMQERMQQEVALIRVEASSGGGMVTVKMDGHKNVLAVKIDPEVAGDVEMLQDMVVAACKAACWVGSGFPRECFEKLSAISRQLSVKTGDADS